MMWTARNRDLLIKARTLQSDGLLFLTAAIWGFAFVAQREGSEHVGPLLFNGTRFLLGSIWLLPFLWKFSKKQNRFGDLSSFSGIIIPGIVLGLVLFVAASFQQLGIGHTTAGKAGFITGMYVIFVPLFGIFLKKKINMLTGISAVLAFIGLYLLSIHHSLELAFGDLLVLVSAVFWAIHVLFIDYYVDTKDALALAFIQFSICAFLSLTGALLFEEINIQAVLSAKLPIVYAGLCSVGIGYTIQLFAQKDAHPAHAAIILSLEGLFAAIGGWLLLSEVLTLREFFGCLLMLSGMVLSQMQFKKIKKRSEYV